jgi:hypothetical protein
VRSKRNEENCNARRRPARRAKGGENHAIVVPALRAAHSNALDGYETSCAIYRLATFPQVFCGGSLAYEDLSHDP